MNTRNGSRPSTDEYFLQMAELVARRGTCARRQVGCVLVDEWNHVMATGYNGVCRGAPHCSDKVEVPNPNLRSPPTVEHWESATVLVLKHPCPGATAQSGQALHLCQAIHAEENALIQCRSVNDIYSVYTTASPCVLCMRKLVGTGVKRIVFREEYPHYESQRMAEDRGIHWIHLP